MEKTKLPSTPFSTAFSGNNSETALRVETMALGRQKRPALPLFALAVLTICICGGLVACQEEMTTKGIKDMEATLVREGYSVPVGVGSTWDEKFFAIADGKPTVERMDGGYVSYGEGSYEDFWQVKELATVFRIYAADEKRRFIDEIVVNDPAFSTPRGIHVGSTLEELFAVYPEVQEGEIEGYYRYRPDGSGPRPCIDFHHNEEGVITMICVMYY